MHSGKLLSGAALAAVMLAFAGPSWTADEVIDPLALSTICSSGDGAPGSAPAEDKAPPKMLPGFGKGGMKIATASPDAQRWFDYGLQLARAFQHEPAKQAFAEAARLDPACAMCAWGQAWAAGPTINFGVSRAEKAAALKAAERALTLAEGGPEKERALIATLIRRYGEGDAAYARAMGELADRWPDDDEILILAADADMIQWKDAGLKRAVGLLETVLKRNPDHPGAIHFYIHVTEGLDEPARAVAYADRLQALAPAASHLIHMPSHTYYRVGRYKDAARANLDAIEADKAWMAQTAWTRAAWDVPYYSHNVSFALGGALMAGDAAAALRIADHYGTVSALALASPWVQMSVGDGWIARGLYMDPDAMLALPDVASDQAFIAAMRHYARGEAWARKGDAAAVRREAEAIRPAGSKYLKTQLEIARGVLLGREAMLEGRYKEAAAFYRAAADREEKTFGLYGDPPVWWYPVRRSEAAAVLAQGRPGPAAELARRVLKTRIDDPMALLVLARAEQENGRTAAAREAFEKAQAGWSGGDLGLVPMSGI